MAGFGSFLALVALAASAAAEGPDWIAQIGVDYNHYPGGSSDPFNYFGAFEGSIDDYPDTWDVVDPGYPDHAIAWIFRGDQHGDNPTYPENGLAWDIREPYDVLFKVWKTEVVGTDEGYLYDLYYSYDPFSGFPLPEGWVCRLDMDGEITPNNFTDLSLYELDLGHSEGYALTNLPQSGGSETWYIIAGIPEPALAQLGGLLISTAWILQGLRRR